jgi:hypothetical protein
MKVEQITIDAGNEVVMLEDATQASGFLHGIITNRRPAITANPESVLVATQNRHNIWTTSTAYALQITLDGHQEWFNSKRRTVFHFHPNLKG